MEQERNDNIKNYATPYQKFQGKAVLILCNNGYKYQTACVEVYEDSIGFVDKFGKYCIIAFSEILSIKERDSSDS